MDVRRELEGPGAETSDDEARDCEGGRGAVRSSVADVRWVSESELPGVELSRPESSYCPGMTRVAFAILKSSERVEW